MLLNKSASRTIDLLDLLAFSQKPLTLKEICDEMSLPKSSAFELVYTLMDRGAVEYGNKDAKTFKVSIKMFQIGAAVIARTDLYQEAHSVIQSLSQQTGETVYLAVEKNNRIVYLDKAEADSPIRSTQVIGSSNYMHLTGLGKALLAAHTDDEVREIVGMGELATLTPYSICTTNALLDDLKETRLRGYAIDNRESMEYVKCVAAPVRGYDGKAVAAISTTALNTHMTDDRVAAFGKLVMAAALDISNRLGFMGTKLY